MLGPIHKTPEEFENALRLKHTVHTNPSRKQSFSKMLFQLEEFENSGPSAFSCEHKAFWKRSFFANYGVTIILWFLYLSFPQT